MIVRKAREDEAELLSELHHAIFETSVWESSFWRDSVRDPGCSVLIAEGDEGPAGLVAARQILDEAEILTIGVLPAARREGLGQELLLQTQAVLTENGTHKLFLEVAEANHAAIGLYLSAGFGRVGHRKDYYGTGKPAILMEWRTGLPPDRDRG
ncbi:MAG: GNAT family N-acetyltransferase [Pseudomonadota bacterium]